MTDAINCKWDEQIVWIYTPDSTTGTNRADFTKGIYIDDKRGAGYFVIYSSDVRVKKNTTLPFVGKPVFIRYFPQTPNKRAHSLRVCSEAYMEEIMWQ